MRSRRDLSTIPKQGQHNFVEDQEEISETGDWINTVYHSANKNVRCTVPVNNKKVTFQLDTVSSVNLMIAYFTTKVTSASTTLKM